MFIGRVFKTRQTMRLRCGCRWSRRLRCAAAEWPRGRLRRHPAAHALHSAQQKKQNFPYDRSPFRHGGSRRADDKARPGKMMHPYPKMDTTEALRRQKRKAEITGIESCIQQTDNPRQKTKNLSNFFPFYITGKLGKIQVICIKNIKQIRCFARWKRMDFLV